MPEKRWSVIVNPAAGARSAGKKWDAIRETLEKEGVLFDFYFTESCAHAIGLVRQRIENGDRDFIVVGGDGTLNEAVNGIMSQNAVPSSEITLAIIPVGSGNDWIRTWKIPLETSAAIDLIKTGRFTYHDIGKTTYRNVDGYLENRWFINGSGTGLDSLTVKTANEKEKHGSRAISYFLSLLKELFRYRAVETEAIVDGEKISGPMLDLAVGICRYIGGGMYFFPEADPTDGLFDVTFIDKMNFFNILRAIPKLFNGKIYQLPAVHALKGKKVEITAKEPLLLETDGEVLGFSPFSFEMIPKAIRMIVR